MVFDDCFSTVTAEAAEPEEWRKLFTFHSQTWDQFDEDEYNFEASQFEREELERRTQAARMQGRKEGSIAPNHGLSELKEGSIAPNHGLSELKEGSIPKSFDGVKRGQYRPIASK